MRMRISIDPETLREAQRLFGPEFFPIRVSDAMNESLAFLQSEIQKRTPVDTGLTRERIFTAYRGAVVDGWQGIVASPDEHTVVLEYGRKPGSMPPVAALEQWGLRKFGKPGLGWALAMKIFLRGTKPLKMFRDTARQSQHVIQAIWLRHLKVEK